MFAKTASESSIRKSGHFDQMAKELIPKPTKEEQYELIRRFNITNDERERQRVYTVIYRSYWRLVYKLANEFRGNLDFDAAYMAGCIGLLQALKK